MQRITPFENTASMRKRNSVRQATTPKNSSQV
jgi:hypothetical protein